MTANHSESNNRKPFLSNYQALIIAAVPVIFYLIYTFFKLGYNSYFNIPRDLFTVNLSEIFRDMDQIINRFDIKLFLVISISTIIFALIDNDWEIAVVFTPLFISLVFLTQEIIMIINSGIKQNLVDLFAIVFYLLSFYLLIPLLIIKDKVSLPMKFLFLMSRKNETTLDINWYAIINLMTFVYLAFTSFFNAGYLTAAEQSEFYIADTSPECIVLSFHEEYALCYPYDRKTNSISNEFYIIDTSANYEVMFTFEDIGSITIQ